MSIFFLIDMSFPLLRAAYSQKKKKEKINCSNNIPPWFNGSFRKLAEILILFFLTIKFELQTFKTKC